MRGGVRSYCQQRKRLSTLFFVDPVPVSKYQQQHLKEKKDLARPFGQDNGMSLDQYLKSFLETLWWQEAKVTAGDDVFQREFDSLRRQSTPAGEKNAQEALKNVNRPKNRYKDIVPFDYARVVLSQYPGVPGSDYVNASLIRGASGSSRAYIAAQGPLPHTVTDFWRMIWEFNVSVIVMTCNEIEGDRYKCEKYWPDQIGERQQHGNVSVTLEGWKQVCPDFLVRTLRARCGQTTRTIRQFHYTTWPDHGVPAIISPIIELVRLVRDCQPSEALPVLVHCSAGCGRTGTFCAIDYVHGLVRYGKLNSNLSLFKIIQEMRQQRVAMVQTRDQYVLVHKVVGALFEQQLKLLDSHIYQNIDTLLQSRGSSTAESPGRLERSKSMGSLEGRLVGKATVIRRAQQPNGQQASSGRLFGATLIPKGHERVERAAPTDMNNQGHDNNANHQMHIQPSMEDELMKTRRTSSGTLWTQV